MFWWQVQKHNNFKCWYEIRAYDDDGNIVIRARTWDYMELLTWICMWEDIYSWFYDVCSTVVADNGD